MILLQMGCHLQECILCIVDCFFHTYLTVMKSGVIHYVSNVKCLFTLQKKAIRLICNADRLANAMFKDMSILKLSEFVKYKTAIVMFNIIP